ncbi:uncharacterized protein LOC118743059 [Rhagoletis pomonella]|uniref:uncharacterized protein LOC118743059 n=1 Tax=Rhagoletis pomonella TaxID=28610 RepID=UPI001780358A|nr:uncharacterized protein LOC118743059 [Rhagoletis pomonella]
MKSIVLICLLFAAIKASHSASSTWGVRNVTDTLFLNENAFYPAKPRQAQIVYYDIYQNNNRVISAIYLQDQFKNSTGPTNTLVSGGPGYTYASVQMTTSTSIGLNVTFVVYVK